MSVFGFVKRAFGANGGGGGDEDDGGNGNREHLQLPPKRSARRGKSTYADSVTVSVRDLVDPPTMAKGAIGNAAAQEAGSSGKGDPPGGPSKVSVLRDMIMSKTVRLCVENYPSALVPRTKAEEEQIARSKQFEKVQNYLALEEATKQRVVEATNKMQQETTRRFYDLTGSGRSVERDPMFRSMVIHLWKQKQLKQRIEMKQYTLRTVLHRMQTQADIAQLDRQFREMMEAIVDMNEQADGPAKDEDSERQKLDTLLQRMDVMEQNKADTGLMVDQMLGSMAGGSGRRNFDERFGLGSYEQGQDRAADPNEESMFAQCFREMLKDISPEAYEYEEQQRRNQQQQQQSPVPVAAAANDDHFIEGISEPDLDVLRALGSKYERLEADGASSSAAFADGRRGPALPPLASRGGGGGFGAGSSG